MTSMEHELTTQIESWLRVHNDGEFFTDERYPYSMVPPSVADGTIIWTTKNHSVAEAVCDAPPSAKLGMVARYGLPHVADIAHILNFVGRQRLFFLGDMDPDDLLVFAWLRAQLHPKQIEYFGICDKFLADRNVEIPNNSTIQLSESELTSLSLLERVCPDFRDLIGDRCSKRLASGCKIELEAVVSALGSASPLLPSQ